MLIPMRQLFLLLLQRLLAEWPPFDPHSLACAMEKISKTQAKKQRRAAGILPAGVGRCIKCRDTWPERKLSKTEYGSDESRICVRCVARLAAAEDEPGDAPGSGSDSEELKTHVTKRPSLSTKSGESSSRPRAQESDKRKDSAHARAHIHTHTLTHTHTHKHTETHTHAYHTKLANYWRGAQPGAVTEAQGQNGTARARGVGRLPPMGCAV